MSRRMLVSAIHFLVFSAWALAAPAAVAAESYSIGVIPSAPPVATHTLWSPFVERLRRDTGLDLGLKVYEKMSDFEQDISRGGPDFLFSHPLQAVVAHREQGYLPLVRGSRPAYAELFVRKDSPFDSIDDLAGRKIAFVGGKSFCYVFTRAEVTRQCEGLWFVQEYTGSTANVVATVLRGKAEAGAAYVVELEKQPRDSREQLRTIFRTPGIASHPLGAHPRVPQAAREAVQRAVLALGAAAEGAELVASVRMPAPVAADYEVDYRPLEDVDVVGLSSWGK